MLWPGHLLQLSNCPLLLTGVPLLRRCFFVFCSLCNDSWHPGSQCMDPQMRLQVLRERMAGNKDAANEFRLKVQARPCPCRMPCPGSVAAS